MGCGCTISITYTNTGGGSGGGFIGKVRLKKGTYKVKVGAKQVYHSGTLDSNSLAITTYYTKPETSYIEGVVSCTGASRNNAGVAPTVSVTPLETTLNRAGNAGSCSATVVDDTTSKTGIVPGASIYNGYGKGSDNNMSTAYEADGSTWKYPGSTGTDGYIKIVYTGN